MIIYFAKTKIYFALSLIWGNGAMTYPDGIQKEIEDENSRCTWLASQAGAPPSIVGRHMVIAVFLILASYFLGRVARQQAQAGGDE